MSTYNYTHMGGCIILIQLDTVADIFGCDISNIEGNAHILRRYTHDVHRPKCSIFLVIVITDRYRIALSGCQFFKGYLIIIRTNRLFNPFSTSTDRFHADLDISIIAEGIIDLEMNRQFIGALIDTLDVHTHTSGNVLALAASVDGTTVSASSACTTSTAISTGTAVSAASASSAHTTGATRTTVSTDTATTTGTTDTASSAFAADTTGAAVSTVSAVSAADRVGIFLASQIKRIFYYIQCRHDRLQIHHCFA